jgi:hypothetical protein
MGERPRIAPKQIYIAGRPEGASDEGFVERWRRHGSFVRSLPLWRHIRHYEQCVVRRDWSDIGDTVPAREASYDMVGMVWFRSTDAVAEALADPTVEQVYADERETFREAIAETSLMSREVVKRDIGGTRAKVVAFVKRKPGTTRAEFSDYWENSHGPLFLATEEVSGEVVKYVQNHTLETNTGPLDEFDGVVEIGFREPGQIAAAFGHPAYLEKIRPDEERFLDLERMIVVNTDEKLLYEDALCAEETGPAASS